VNFSEIHGAIVHFLSIPFVQTTVTAVHVLNCVLLVLVVLIQSGKGAEISASFAGSSQTVFGISGGANFFTHFTRGSAALFMICAILLTVGGGRNNDSLMEGAGGSSTKSSAPATPAAPAAPATGNTAPAPAAPAAPKK